MGILTRFKDIMSSNVNSMLDKAEDPEKMIDQCLRNLNSDLGKVKSETAAVMANETRVKRELDECNGEITKMQDYASKAVAAGNDDDARKFLSKKQELVSKQTELSQALETAQKNSENMKAMNTKLVKDIADMESRRDTIKSKIQVAKMQNQINEMTSSASGANDSISSFERMEKKADEMLDKANATAELNQTENDADGIDSLTDKYDSASTGASSAAVEDELAALKAGMNK
jgi:phage shock protein A